MLGKLDEFELEANGILTSQYWNDATEFLSAMNKRTIEKVAEGKASAFSEIMLEYVPHALEQGKQALVKAKKVTRINIKNKKAQKI